MKLVWAF